MNIIEFKNAHPFLYREANLIIKTVRKFLRKRVKFIKREIPIPFSSTDHLFFFKDDYCVVHFRSTSDKESVLKMIHNIESKSEGCLKLSTINHTEVESGIHDICFTMLFLKSSNMILDTH